MFTCNTSLLEVSVSLCIDFIGISQEQTCGVLSEFTIKSTFVLVRWLANVGIPLALCRCPLFVCFSADFLNAKSTYGTSSSSYVLFIPDLEARCWHDTKSELVNAVNSGGFCRSEVLDQLRGEFHAAFFDSKACWQANNTKGVKAGWRTLYLVNQGQPVKEHIALCPKTAAALECVGAGLMRNCVFANACFSVLEPGAHIARHRGPCNVRIRCHVPLYCPDQCWLRVGDERRFWSELYSSTANGFFLFDDAFEHEVQHTGLEQDGARVIFMFDLWHPDLLEVERQAISYICSPWLDEAKAS